MAIIEDVRVALAHVRNAQEARRQGGIYQYSAIDKQLQGASELLHRVIEGNKTLSEMELHTLELTRLIQHIDDIEKLISETAVDFRDRIKKVKAELFTRFDEDC